MQRLLKAAIFDTMQLIYSIPFTDVLGGGPSILKFHGGSP